MIAIKEFQKSVYDLVELFQTKTGLDFDFWLGGNFATIASFSTEYCFTLDQIYYCIDEGIPRNYIFHWHNYNTDRAIRKDLDSWSINIDSYCKLRKGQDLTDTSFSIFLDNFLKKDENDTK
jgi:hypothetical protein